MSRRGLAVGKFWPPHRGHDHLIEQLSRQCDKVVVLVCASPAQRPAGAQRAAWLQAIHPKAEVVLTDDLCAWHHPEFCGPGCTPVWARRVRDLGLIPLDVVATSEGYGDGFASALGAQHLSVDPGRSQVAVSGTAVRSDVSGHWHDLHPVVRAGLHRRVVVLGSESTGTSTLAADLAAARSAPLAPEAGRTVSWELYAQAGSMEAITWTEAVFWQIIERQIRFEADAVFSGVDRPPGRGGPWLICDTDTLATVAWWERYLGTPADAVLALAGARVADLYLVTSCEGVPFDNADPLRDGEAIRERMHRRLLELVIGSGAPYLELVGSRRDRLETALGALSDLEQRYPLFDHS